MSQAIQTIDKENEHELNVMFARINGTAAGKYNRNIARQAVEERRNEQQSETDIDPVNTLIGTLALS